MDTVLAPVMHFIHTVSGVTLDVIVLAIVLVVFASIGFYFGRGKLIALVLAFYPAVLLYEAFPYVEKFTFWRGSVGQVGLSHLLIFFILFIVCYLVIHSVYHDDITISGGERMMQIGVLSLSLLIVGMVLTHIVIPITGVYDFTPTVAGLFRNNLYFWWLIAPLAGVYFGAR